MGQYLGKDRLLPSMGAESNSVTVSGISGGSFAASQLHVIFSDMIHGSGLLVGGPYGDNYQESQSNLAPESIVKAENYYSQGMIDNLENLANDPVYIFSGAEDTVVYPQKQEGQRDFFTNYNANVEFVQKDVDHMVPSVFNPPWCDFTKGSDCTYDTAGAMFTHLLTNLENGSVSSLNAYSEDWQSAGTYRRFLQDEFVDKDLFGFSGLAKFGYVYYPDACLNKECKLHMHLHCCGCQQQGITIGQIPYYGILQYAITNDIIVIFPQAEFSLYWNNLLPCFASDIIFPEPEDEDKYLTNQAVQTKALKAMLDRGIEARDSEQFDYKAGNLLTLGFFGNMVQDWWFNLWNWPDIVGRRIQYSELFN